jgi:hypothetical protein
MSVLLVAGIGVFVAGLVAAAFGVPVKEFSFGNTLILSGAVIACTGLIMISLSLVVRELRVIARRLRSGPVATERNDYLRLPELPLAEAGGDIVDDHRPLQDSGQTMPDVTDPVGAIPSPLPWQAEVSARNRGAVRDDIASPELPSAPATPPKPRRNLLFTSSSRKERERAMTRSSDPAADSLPPFAPAAPDPDVSPPPSFDDAWPRSDRSRTELGRQSSVASPADAGTDRDRAPADGRNRNSPAVTVLKSGVVDGMAYSLYSDGSIEAQMPEGMMRFASIDELRAHLDQRP